MSKAVLEKLRERFGVGVFETHSDFGDDTAVVNAMIWKDACQFLRTDPQLDFDMLVDLCGVDYPTRVVSIGGRYHFDDDWQFPDTQEATFEFADGKRIVWSGQSCNGLPTQGRSRGSIILGTNGSMVIDQDGYIVYDHKNKVVKDVTGKPVVDALNTTGDDALTSLHQANFVAAVRTGIPLTAPISDGAKTGMLCHLGTIAQQTGRILHTNPANGHIIGDVAAMKLWRRTYQPGWTPVI